jgi:NAD(P) transhydrogenase subunit alpha
MSLILGVPKEAAAGERRVALVPRALAPLQKSGMEILVEAGAGAASGYPDEEYAAKGARIAASRDELFASAAVLVCVRVPGTWSASTGAAASGTAASGAAAPDPDLARLRPGQVVIGFADPLALPEASRELAARGVSLLAMEMMPRITRAQGMDALSSMATLAGYKAVLLAADALPRLFPMLMTAAGTVTPARVLVLGAGVAGLFAAATARRLGAVVSAYDVRPAAREQVESVGAKFVSLPLDSANAEDRGGYAREMDADFLRRQRELMTGAVREHDVVISTAAVPGKRAPILVTRDMVAGMAPGSVIVDVAAERGGNCELTRPGEVVVEHGVTIVGTLNLAGAVPYHASQLYAKNVASFLGHLVRDGAVRLDTADEITRETLIAHGGEVVHERIRQQLGLPAQSAATGAPATPATPATSASGTAAAAGTATAASPSGAPGSPGSASQAPPAAGAPAPPPSSPST